MKGFFSGEVILVTGAAQGNGYAIAAGLAAAGAHVVITDINEDRLVAAREAIEKSGGKASAYRLDVTDAQACKDVAARVAAEIGPAKAIVNNAGIIVREGLETENAPAVVRKVMDVNYLGTFNVAHAFIPQLKATRGSVINIASIGAFVGWTQSAGYSPSKGAVKLLTQALAAELAPFGVRVNAIAPGVMETPMTEGTRADEARLGKLLERIPMARVGKPEELVGPTIFLASDMSSYMTGAIVPVDGGYLAA